MAKPTQAQVNEAFKDGQAAWDAEYRASDCLSITMFCMQSKWALHFLAEYQEIKEIVESHGLVMPVLDKTITISFKDQD
ncbi:MAG: hypothetical protein MJK15_00675 [Colwellia sp.]|nr:hypothetical protein [Colwellia sp.]